MVEYLRMGCKYRFATLYDQGHIPNLTINCSSINLCTMTMVIIGHGGYIRMFLLKPSQMTVREIAHSYWITHHRG